MYLDATCCTMITRWLVVVWVLLRLKSSSAQRCVSKVCEYKFVVTRIRSMTFADATDSYNVKLHNGRLVTAANTFRDKISFPFIGTEVPAKDVITLDGYPRNVVAVNGQHPAPTIEVNEDAEVVVTVTNKLALDVITIHWHGIHVENTPWMDGAELVQCPIAPGETFTYRFLATPAGTHFYHDHFSVGRRDGLFGMFIVHEKQQQQPPSNEFTMMVYDWYHDSTETAYVNSADNPNRPGTGENYNRAAIRDYGHDGSEVALRAFDASLINGRGRSPGMKLPLQTYAVKSGQTYRFRVANSASDRAFQISVDQHVLFVVAMDGVDIQPVTVESLNVFSGETIDFKMVASQGSGLFWLRAITLREGHGPTVIPDGIINGVNAIIVYKGTPLADPVSKRQSCTASAPCITFNCPFANYTDKTHRRCFNPDQAKSTRSKTYLNQLYGLNSVQVQEHFLNFAAVTGMSINARTFVAPSEPFYQATHVKSAVPCDKQKCDNAGCKCTHVLDLPYGKTIQFIYVNIDPLNNELEHHPVHMHGHNFAVLKIGYPTFDRKTGRFLKNNQDIQCNNDLCSAARWRAGRAPDLNLVDPAARDTVTVPGGGYAVVRIRTDNPGIWAMHCHILSHSSVGMAMFLREAEPHIPPVPKNFPTCTGHFAITPQTFRKYQMPRKEIACYTFNDDFDDIFGGTSVNSGMTLTHGTVSPLFAGDTRDNNKNDYGDNHGENKDGDKYGGWLSSVCRSKGCVKTAYGGDSKLVLKGRAMYDFEKLRTFALSIWFETADVSKKIIASSGANWGTLPTTYLATNFKSRLVVSMTDKNRKTVTFRSKQKLETSSWQHVVLSYNGQTMSVYLNGQHIGDKLSKGAAKSIMPLTLGNFGNKQKSKKFQPFSGKFDQVCVYNVGLTAEDAKKLFDEPSTTRLV